MVVRFTQLQIAWPVERIGPVLAGTVLDGVTVAFQACAQFLEDCTMA